MAISIIAMIAKKLGVQENDVIEMNRRLSGDASLNTEVHADEAGEVQDWLVDPAPSPEAMYADQEEAKQRRRAPAGALEILNTRERCIFEARFLSNRRSGLRSSRHDTAFRASGCGKSKFAHLKKFGLPFAPRQQTVAVQRNETGNPLLALHREERRAHRHAAEIVDGSAEVEADCDQRKVKKDRAGPRLPPEPDARLSSDIDVAPRNAQFAQMSAVASD